MDNKTCRLTRTLLSAAFFLLWSDSIIGGAAGAVQEPSQTEAEARLRERVSEYWTAMEKADYEAAVPVLAPGFPQSIQEQDPQESSVEVENPKA